MNDMQTVLKTYGTELDADIDKGRLEAAGIKAEITSDDCGGMRPHLAYSLGVKLLVFREDEIRAKELLDTEESATAAAPKWNCAKCQEENEGGFDACWNCGEAH
jgi:hypothetical protein